MAQAGNQKQESKKMKPREVLALGIAIIGLALIVSGTGLKQWVTTIVGVIILVSGFGLGAFLEKREKKKKGV